MREPAGDFCNQARHYLRQSKQLPGITVCSPGVMPSEFDDPQTYKIIGAAMAVHRELGCGFLEAVSREALTIELREREVPFVREARLPVHYRDRLLPLFYTVDFICYDEVLVELKALRAIGPVEEGTADQLSPRRASQPSACAEFRCHESSAQATGPQPGERSRGSLREGMTSGAGREAAASHAARLRRAAGRHTLTQSASSA